MDAIFARVYSPDENYFCTMQNVQDIANGPRPSYQGILTKMANLTDLMEKI